MEKRIKIVYILTAIALVLLFMVQSVWLHGQYRQSANIYQEELTATIEDVISKENSLRRLKSEGVSVDEEKSYVKIEDLSSLPPNSESVITTISNMIALDGSSVTNFKIAIRDSVYIFNVQGDVPQDKLFSSPMRFIVDHNIPMDIHRIDSLLRDKGINGTVSSIKLDTMVWKSNSKIDYSLLIPRSTIEIPYDNLQGQVIRVVSKIPFTGVISQMIGVLCLSLFISMLIIYCFFYQIATIRRQRRIDEVRQDFLHTMIHELKRPISTLKVCMSSLRNEKLMSGEGVKENILQSSYKELDNLTAYFSKLRDVTMADSGNIPLNISQVKLPSLIDDLISKITIPSGKKVSLVKNSSDDVVIHADGLHLQNILHNLIENAVKYSGDDVRISLDYYCSASKLILVVADNGLGIAPSDLPHVFDKFYRGRNLGSIAGIGLGLSYVKMLTQAHGGSIAVESSLGHGSKFTIKLPL